MKKYLWKYRLRILGLSVIVVWRQLSLIVVLYCTGEQTKAIVERHIIHFLHLSALMLGTWLFLTVLDYYSYLQQHALALDIEEDLRYDVVTKLVDTDYHSFHQYSIGHYLSWLSNDIHTIKEKGIIRYFQLLRDIAILGFSALGLLYYHWSFLVVNIIGFIIAFFLPRLWNQSLREVSLAATQADERLMTVTEDQLQGYSVYVAFTKLKHLVYRL